jgi:tetratricopeptide (TPR) repeat protein/predicted Ser/Thr protein kinase
MDLEGQRFGHIRVSGVVGKGGMGAVYSGYDETLERRVALKILHAGQRLGDETRDRLLREARALSRLDHPNICRIHDYIDNGDSDLLVLEFIDGKTLDALRHEKTTRAEKLRIAISIASVLVAAHRAGIIHRDLKPENVMLTKNGEVKVLDFGLVRWLNRGRGTRAAENDTTAPYPVANETPSGEREFLATAAGLTVGTPVYMSPEQARGEPLAPASDMFSFGLLLQALFSGAEAHDGVDSAGEVMLRVARGETNPVQNVPRDIAALIARLKMFAPADRPTAVETLERLQELADKPRRIARRAIAAALAAIALIGAWRYTVDLQRERTAALAAEARAVDARKEAERRRGQAEDLIDFMMGDLHHKLAPIARLDALDAAADRAITYMSSLRPELMSADELGRNAIALQHVGEVRLAQGKFPDALRAFELSLAIAQKAVAKDPKKLDLRFTLGQEQFWVGEIHRQMGHKREALATMRDYLATSELLARAAPQNLDYQVELAYGYSNIGSLLQSEGNFAGAIEHYERAVAVKKHRLRTNPANREWQGDLAQTINKIGAALQRQGRLIEARKRFGEERAIYQSLVNTEPTNKVWKTRLGTSCTYLGILLTNLGDLDAAEAELAVAEKTASELVTFDPDNVGWRRDLAAVLQVSAITQRMRGQLGVARTQAARAELLIREVVRAAPQNTTWQRDLGYITVRYAVVLYASGATAAAKRRAESVLASVPNPGDGTWLPVSAESLLLLGDIAAKEGRIAAAREAWRKSADLLSYATFAKGDLGLLDIRARALVQLGRAGEAEPILEDLRRAQYANPDLMKLPRVAARVSESIQGASPI